MGLEITIMSAVHKQRFIGGNRGVGGRRRRFCQRLAASLALAALLTAAPVWTQTPSVTLISTGATWKYLAPESDPGSTWVMPAFDDQAWPSGPAQLGYGDGDEATVIPLGTNATSRPVTHYFRHSLVVPNAGGLSNVLARVQRDDGVILYVNGVEVFRNNLPEGLVDANTLASATVEDPPLTFLPAVVPRGLLFDGTNVVAAEVHQAAPTSTDLSFDLELVAHPGTNAGPPILLSAPQPRTVVRGGSTRLEATAFGAPLLQYRWLRGNTLFNSGSTNSNDLFLVLSNQTASTNFTLIVSNAFGAVTSSPVAVTVLIDADLDRLPDTWETNYGLATNIVADAGFDNDGDGQSNRSEFVAGSNPTNAASLFRALPAQTYATAGERIVLSAPATNAAGLSYQWYFNGTAINGARSANLALFDVSAASSGLYTVVATNYSGSATSTPARLDVVPPATLSVVAGWQLIANQFDRGGNTLDEIMPGVPDGCVVVKFVNASQTWATPSLYVAGSGWQPKNITLSPGEGAFLHSPSAFSLTFQGRTRTPVLPLSLPGGWSMVSRQLAVPGDFASIVGPAPIAGDEVHRWSRPQQEYVRVQYDGDFELWLPTVPVAAVGEAWWVRRGGPTRPNMPPYVMPVSNQVVQAGSTSAPVRITVLDVDAGPNASVTVQSSNPQVLSSGELSLNTSQGSLVLVASPTLNQSGTTELTVTASDGVSTRTQVFTVNVLPAPPAPRDCVRETTGTNFWLTFPGNASPDLGEVTRPYLSLIGTPGTTGRVEILGIGFVAGFSLDAQGTSRVVLPTEADLGNALETIERKGIQVIAGAPVSVAAVNDLRYTTDAFLVSPAEMLGQAHVVMAYPNNHEDLPSLNGSQLALVAMRPDTTVTIVPSADVGAHPAGVPWTIQLQVGETYQLRATNNGSADLTGTRIEADQPVAVFAGHQCATVPSSEVFFCNYVAEQVPPLGALGTNFFVVPLQGRPRSTVRCVMAEDNTLITVSGIPPGPYGRGAVLSFTVTAGTPIRSTRPIAVAQFGHSADDDGRLEADPTMITMVSDDRWLTNVALVALSDFTNHLNIVMTDGADAGVTIDGVPVSLGAPQLGHRLVSLGVAPGPHRVRSSRPAQVTVYGYSLNRYDAYGYLAGARLPELLPPTVSGPASVVVSAGTQCQAPVPVVSVTAFGSCADSGVLTVVQTPAAGTPRDVGVHWVTNTVTDARGAMARWLTQLVVQDLRPGYLLCPTNLVMECTNRLGNVVTFRPFATNACGRIMPVTCSPPSGTVFHLGTNLVTCRVNDPSGPTNSCSFTVAVVDRTPPIIQCSTNRLVQATNDAGALVQYAVTASDACDPLVTIVCTPPSGQVFPVGQTNVVCRATDDSGNQASCSFAVTVLAPPLVLASPAITNTTVAMAFVAPTGYTYVVEYRTNLTEGTWTVLTNIVGTGAAVQVNDPIRTNIPGRFYRLRR